MEIFKFFADVQLDPSLGERQIRVIANSGKSDRVKDVLVASGCKTENYVKNPIVLADHDRSQPIGNFSPEIKDGAVAGVITFAPKGISAKADEYCGLYKHGVMKSVSVGFNPIEYEPNKGGGYDFKQWELLELSCVSVPCDAGAVVTARALPEEKPAQWKCGASLNLPIAPDGEFDAEKAAESIFAHCGFGGAEGAKIDLSLARKGFLVYDAANPTDKASYRFPFAKVLDGRLTAASVPVVAEDGLSTDVIAKAVGVGAHYAVKLSSGDDQTAVEWFKALPLDEQLVVKALSSANMDHVKGLAKCMAAMSDCQVKAMDSHIDTHEHLTAFAQHLAAAGEHMKALRAAGRKKPKPSGDDGGEYDGSGGDPEDPDDDDSDNELAYQAERRKREIEIAERA